MEDMDYAEVFREEASELLEELETSLLELEKNPSDLKLVARVFRAMHTIKGSGAMFGFDEVSDFTHHVETVLDKVRDGSIPVTKELIGLILQSRDQINSLLVAAMSGGTVNRDRGAQIIGELEQFIKGGAPAAEQAAEEETIPAVVATPPPPAEPRPAAPPPPKPQPSAPPQTAQPPAVSAPVVVRTLSFAPEEIAHYCIYFEPRPEFFEVGGDVEQILGDLRELGEMTVFAKNDGSGPREAGEGLFWDILLTTAYDRNAIQDVFIFAENSCRLQIIKLEKDETEVLPEHRKLGQILVDRGEISLLQLKSMLGQQKPLGQLLIESKLVAPARVESAIAEQMAVDAKRSRTVVVAPESIRVAPEKLDSLINLVGELVVTQARLSQIVSQHPGSDLVETAEEIERLTTELRDNVLNIRMLPIGTTFAKFKRLVRDLSTKLGKEVELVTEGAETELDKSVIDKLGDPLVHLIRNSIDHGVELPEERLRAGKPAKATIKLAAIHSGAHVIIRVSDDGRGLDADTIRTKAQERGLVAAGDTLSREEVFRLIFLPGFTTSAEVTSVSGRGVGMDVVKTVIEGTLKGAVSVSSEIERGTTVAITLPLTLAIIDGLLVQVGDTHFVLPLTMVEECVELSASDMCRFRGRQLYTLREHIIPFVRLEHFFGIPSHKTDLHQLVVVNVNGDRFGLVLDDVIGGYQTVIKSLGWVYRNAVGVAGATILGNGQVALIVDIASIVEQVKLEQNV